MRRRLLRTISLTAMAGLLAFDVGGTSVAIAHNFEETAGITLRTRPRSVPRGQATQVTFFGRVRNNKWFCRANRIVRVEKLGRRGGFVGATKSRKDGSWALTQRARPGRYVASIRTRARGEHPHRHVCYGNRSNIRRIQRR